MRNSPVFLLMALSVVLSGCPAQRPMTPTVSVEKAAPAPEALAATTQKPQEPSTQDAKDAVKLVSSLNGTFELTAEGTVKSIVVTDGATLDESAIDLFAKQTDLEKLFIKDFRILNDAMVEKLAGLKKLKSLQLTNSGISDAALKTIAASFSELANLDISSNVRLTDNALKEIAKMANLESLSMMYCDFSEFGILNISEMPKLKALDIRANMQVGNSGMGYIASLPALKSLKHMSTAVDDFGMESLSQSKGLETLEIQDFSITDRAGDFIRQFEKLTNLIIFRCQGFGSGGLNALKGMNLSRLTLRDLPSLDDAGMEAFRELPTMRRLYLRELNSVSDTGVMNLVYLKDLDTLDVQEVPVSDKSVESIAKLENLKTLTLKSTEITDVAVDMLLAMPKLENLTITDNAGVTEQGLQKLTESKKFKKLETVSSVPKR